MAIIHDVLCLAGFLQSVMYDNKLHDVPNFFSTFIVGKIIIPTASAQKEREKGDAEGSFLIVC